MADDVTEVEIRAVLAETYTAEGVEIYMRSRNRMFDGATPLELIARGEGLRVLNVAGGLADGVMG